MLKWSIPPVPTRLPFQSYPQHHQPLQKFWLLHTTVTFTDSQHYWKWYLLLILMVTITMPSLMEISSKTFKCKPTFLCFFSPSKSPKWGGLPWKIIMLHWTIIIYWRVISFNKLKCLHSLRKYILIDLELCHTVTTEDLSHNPMTFNYGQSH